MSISTATNLNGVPMPVTGLNVIAMLYGVWQRDGVIFTRKRIGLLTAACRPWWPTPMGSSKMRQQMTRTAMHRSGAT